MKPFISSLDRYFIRYSAWAMCVLMGLAWWFILADQPEAISDLFQAENGTHLRTFLTEMAGLNEALPAYLDGDLWQTALQLSVETLLMSILATGIAFFAVLFLVLPTLPLTHDSHSQARRATRWLNTAIYGLMQLMLRFSRAVPELMWAMILVFIFKVGVLAGAMALAIHNAGVLGKLLSEAVENQEKAPIRHLAENGATRGQLLLYGILPTLFGPFLNYTLYRMENIIRATLIVGLVGASGLGMAFKLAMSFFHYSEITLYLLCYLLLVYLSDLLSAWLRARLKMPD